jgi:hypothetical protein
VVQDIHVLSFKIAVALDDWDNWFGGVDSDTRPSESDSHDEFDDS